RRWWISRHTACPVAVSPVPVTAVTACALPGSRSATPAADFASRAIAATVDHTGDPTIAFISISASRSGARASEPRHAEPC
ncbi:MAG: hypothetical protein QOH53_1125, partial [Ilumatobacteraceae bacterium]